MISLPNQTSQPPLLLSWKFQGTRRVVQTPWIIFASLTSSSSSSHGLCGVKLDEYDLTRMIESQDLVPVSLRWKLSGDRPQWVSPDDTVTREHIEGLPVIHPDDFPVWLDSFREIHWELAHPREETRETRLRAILDRWISRHARVALNDPRHPCFLVES